MIDELETQDNIFRDLKGIIFGKEYSHKGGRLTEKDKPSILKKIEFVKQNISVLGNKYGFDYQQIASFEGIITTLDTPPIIEFQGIKILSIDEIEGLK